MMAANSSTQPASRRVAAIDVGTNSIRLVVAEVFADRSYRILDDEKVVTRLGRGLDNGDRLSAEAMKASATAITHLKSIAEGFKVDRIRAAATCAVRKARNRRTLVKMIQEQAGIKLDVISSEAEARLSFTSVCRAFDLRNVPTAVIDIGGGSTEVVLSSGPVIERICPLDLGAVRLTERFDLDECLQSDHYRQVRRFVRRGVREGLGKLPFTPFLVVGTGGTFTNLAAMSMNRGIARRGGDVLPIPVRGYELQRSEVKHFLNMLRKVSVQERARVPGLNPDRADIIVAGLLIVDCVLKQLDANRLRIHDQGLRVGMIHEMIDEFYPDRGGAAMPHVDRMRSVQQFAAACHREPGHGGHVATLALQLFDALAAELEDADWTTPTNRELLEAASLLHDVGYLINYSKHHKHTYQLIMHSGLSGFTRHELELIANIARYHRGARPKLKHANFAALDPDGRRLVKRLASILRLAVGLDRSHCQRVRAAHLTCCDGLVLVNVEADEDPSVELWGAARKSRLFEKTFGVRMHFHWQSDPVPQEVSA